MHPHGPGCVHAWPYCGACPAVSQHCIATQPAARPSSCHDTNDCIMTHPTSQASLLSRYNRLYHDTPQWPSRSPVTIQLIVSRHTLPATPRALALPHALARGRPCPGLSWPCRSALPAMSWPPWRAPDCPFSRYKNCIVTQTGKRSSSPSSFVLHPFFFHPHFFSLFVHLLEDPKNYYYYYYYFFLIF